MQDNAITVKTTVEATLQEAWHYYTESEHVVNWNFASEEWHCAVAKNDLSVGGEFLIKMTSKEGNMSFDLEGTYDEIDPNKHIAYTLKNGREVSVDFAEQGETTQVKVAFDPDEEHGTDHQRDGWQSILNNFRKYVNTLEGAN